MESAVVALLSKSSIDTPNYYNHQKYVHEQNFNSDGGNIIISTPHDFFFKKFLLHVYSINTHLNNNIIKPPKIRFAKGLNNMQWYETLLYPTKIENQYLVIVDSYEEFFVTIETLIQFDCQRLNISCTFILGILENSKLRTKLLLKEPTNRLIRKHFSAHDCTTPLYFLELNIPKSRSDYFISGLDYINAQFILIESPHINKIDHIELLYNNNSLGLFYVEELQSICKYLLDIKTNKNILVIPLSCTNKVRNNTIVSKQVSKCGIKLHAIESVRLFVNWKYDTTENQKQQIRFWIVHCANKNIQNYLMKYSYQPNITSRKDWAEAQQEKNNIKKNNMHKNIYFKDIYLEHYL